MCKMIQRVSDWLKAADLLFTESRAVTETGVVLQDIYFSDFCQVVGTFLRAILQVTAFKPFFLASFLSQTK